MCTGNSCRSQIAEGWLRHLSGGKVEASSAGTAPAGVNPTAVEVMREVGIDLSGHRSQHVSEFAGVRFDAVITVCDHARESCPVWPEAGEMLHWSLDDPAGREMEEFRRVRDEIGSRLREYVASLP